MSNKPKKMVTGAIYLLSLLVPLIVAALFRIKLDVAPLDFLPPIYASINGITFFVLVLSGFVIKKGNIALHEKLMSLALGLSGIFLLCYVAYHITSPTTYFGDINHDGSLSAEEALAIANIRYFYYPLLTSHIILSIVVVPLVLFSFLRGLRAKLDPTNENKRKHKKLVRFAYPIWLYVTLL